MHDTNDIHDPDFQDFVIHNLPLGQLEAFLQVFGAMNVKPITDDEITKFETYINSVDSLHGKS